MPLWQSMRYRRFERRLVDAPGTPVLFRVVHVREVVTVAALAAVVAFHAIPFVLRKLRAFGVEFLSGVDRSQRFVQQLVARLNLADDLRAPVLGTWQSGKGALRRCDLEVDGVAVFA